MRVSDFDYELPAERVAQEPAEPRDAARLLVHERAANATRHRRVRELDGELRAGDLLIVNDTRVLPARLHARRRSGGAVELLLLGPTGDGTTDTDGVWRALVKPAKKLAPGELLSVAEGRLVARMLARERGPDGAPGATWTLVLEGAAGGPSSVEDLLEREGRMPLPPYVRREARGDPRDELDRERYQTVYARERGAVAAPTAGLHFTPELLARLAERGVERASVTLHVGLGTFRPVQVEDVREHPMHAERYVLPAATCAAVAHCRESGGRVVAVGTTSVRVLESRADEAGVLRPGAGETSLFVTPGYRFRCVDALLTNFHLPRSTLLMLVSALAGRERVLALYREALARDYRFYSYGDAMLLLP